MNHDHTIIKRSQFWILRGHNSYTLSLIETKLCTHPDVCALQLCHWDDPFCHIEFWQFLLACVFYFLKSLFQIDSKFLSSQHQILWTAKVDLDTQLVYKWAQSDTQYGRYQQTWERAWPSTRWPYLVCLIITKLGRCGEGRYWTKSAKLFWKRVPTHPGNCLTSIPVLENTWEIWEIVKGPGNGCVILKNYFHALMFSFCCWERTVRGLCNNWKLKLGLCSGNS